MAFSIQMMLTRRLQHWLYELFAFYAIFVGVTSYRYDFKRRLYKNTKCTKLVASFSNLILVSVIVWDVAWLWFDYVDEDGVTGEVVRLDFTVNDIVCVMHLLQRMPRERATVNIEQELESLTKLYQNPWARKDKQSKQDLRRLRLIYLAKNFIMWVLLGFLFTYLIMSNHYMTLIQGNLYVEDTLSILKILAFDSQDVAMHLHFLLSLRICRFYMRLNRRMKELVKRNSPENTLELNHLRGLHIKLTSLMERLTATYDIVMITTRFSLIITSAAMGYYISISESYPRIYQAVGCGFYTLLVLDAYILDLIVDYTVNEHQETLSLLRQHDALEQPDTQLSRGCDLFALQITCFPMQIKPFGLFLCSTATWLSNISCIISWMVVLLQYRIVAEKKRNNI